MKKVLTIPVLAAACVSLTLSTSQAADLELIYSKIPGHPTAVVPGAKDANGEPALTEFRAFHDLVGSPDGSKWLLRARTQLGSGLENILLLGGADEGTAFAQAGQPVHDGEPGELYDFFGSGLGRFNDNNDFAFSARAMGGDFNTKQKVIRVINGIAEIVTQESAPYFGLIDVPGNPSGDELVGNSIGSIHLLNDGTVGAHDQTIKNIHSTRRPALFYDNISFQQRNVTEITGIDGQTQFLWDNMNGNTFYTTPNSSPISLLGGGGDEDRWLCIGRRSGQALSDRVLVVDGQIVIETGEPLPGAPNIVNSIPEANLASNGDWYARGFSDNSTRAWAVRNGDIIAITSQSVPGTEERWGTTFRHFSGNSNGDWVLIGKTDNPDNTLDEILVVNGQVVVRQGDQIEENVYIGRNNPDNAAFPGDAFVSEDGYVYFLANIVDAEGNEYTGDPPFSTPVAFLRASIEPTEPCLGDLNGDNVVDVSDLLILLSAWGPCPRGNDCPADLNGDSVVDVSDLLILLSAWGACE